jgi:hypothetical protein
MSHLNHDLQEFHNFVSNLLATGQSAATPEQALGEWRLSQRSDTEIADDMAAIQEAILDLENGDEGNLLAEFDQAFRNRHGLTTQP